MSAQIMVLVVCGNDSIIIWPDSSANFSGAHYNSADSGCISLRQLLATTWQPQDRRYILIIGMISSSAVFIGWI
jgi:hypothetical protein